MKIVMVCTGNTCRSPMAEALMRRALIERGVEGVEVTSAGVHAMPGDPVSPEARHEMASRGLDIEAHRARPIHPLDLSGALALCMTDAQLRQLKVTAPDAQADTLLRHAGLEGDIRDPIGAGPEAYRRAADQMQAAIEIIADRIAQSKG